MRCTYASRHGHPDQLGQQNLYIEVLPVGSVLHQELQRGRDQREEISDSCCSTGIHDLDPFQLDATVGEPHKLCTTVTSCKCEYSIRHLRIFKTCLRGTMPETRLIQWTCSDRGGSRKMQRGNNFIY